MLRLVFTNKGRKIAFDDFTDERNEDYGGVWAGMCSACAEKYRDILVEENANRLDPCGSGVLFCRGLRKRSILLCRFWVR